MRLVAGNSPFNTHSFIAGGGPQREQITEWNSEDGNAPIRAVEKHSRASCFTRSHMLSRPHRFKKTSSMQSKRRDLHHTWLHFSIFIKSFSIFKLKGISRFWAVCKTISPISTVVSPFHSKFSQASLHQSEPPSKTSIANQFLCYFHPCHVVVSSLFVVYLKRELLHHGRQVGDEEKTEIRVVSG